MPVEDAGKTWEIFPSQSSPTAIVGRAPATGRPQYSVCGQSLWYLYRSDDTGIPEEAIAGV